MGEGECCWQGDGHIPGRFTENVAWLPFSLPQEFAGLYRLQESLVQTQEIGLSVLFFILGLVSSPWPWAWPFGPWREEHGQEQR